jgi:subtilisin family serine protease
VILPLRAFDSEGIGNSFAVAEAIDYAVMQGADIINMSFGMYTANDVLSNAVDAATSAGVTMVASVGNESVQQATYPAAYDDVVAVSAIDTLEQAAFFTNGGDYVDVCAPGVNLYSSLTGPWDWGTWSGTSFAAPLVTGATALLLSIRPDLSPTGVSETLRQSARTELVSGTVITPDLLLGYGCIDAFSASLAYARGDVDNSGAVDVGDLVRLAGYMFGDGEAPEVSLRMADINCDSTLDISDVVRLTGFMFQGGEPIWPCIE